MSIVLIARFKNERHILYEWVHHHLEEGVDKFILIDDQSDDDYLKCNAWITEYIESGQIEIHDSVYGQFDDYNRFLLAVKQFKWVIQIDLDEFIFNPSKTESLRDILERKFNNTDYIRIRWKLFQHETKYQAKSVIENNVITHREEKDPSSGVAIKCIAKTQNLTDIRTHRCDFSPEIEAVYLSSHNDFIQINHYRTQSDEFLYGVKEIRGGGAKISKYSVENVNELICLNFDKEDLILKQKREKLIRECNLRTQVKPKVYEGSSWMDKINDN